MIETRTLVGSYEPYTRAGETISMAPKGQILPGTSQAKGPQIDGALESSRLSRRLTEGVRRPD